jgi:hypothetical protein
MGRDESRKGLPPDIMFISPDELDKAINLLDQSQVDAFNTTLDNLLNAEMTSHLQRYAEDKSHNKESSSAIDAIDGFLKGMITSVSRAKIALRSLVVLMHADEAGSNPIENARLLVRVLPSGIAILTLTIDFCQNKLSDSTVDKFLIKIDPRLKQLSLLLI